MKILTLLKRMLRFLKKPIILGLAILLLVCLLIWFVGPLIAIGGHAFLASVDSRLIIIIIFLFIWGICNFLLFIHHAKKNKKHLEKEKKPEEQETPPLEAAEYLMQLERSFRRVSRFSRRVLPWHLVIGNFASGKTSLLDKATLGFEFPEGKNLANVDVTDVCSWHLTKEKVFLELAQQGLNGKGTVWKDVLGLLKKYRRRNPLRGITIVCSMAELIQKTKDERKAFAGKLRQRIYDLHRSLGIRIPITLVFNKADLIAGFSEFFEHLSEPEKQQLWGIRFAEGADIAEQFTAGYNDLITRLNERLVSRLHQERDDKRSAAIAAFPLQIAALKPILQDFVQNVVADANFSEPVHLCGTYFASGLQAGAPINLLLDSVADTFNLDKSEENMSCKQSNIAYFVTQLFDTAVLRDVKLTRKSQKKQRLFLKWSGIVGGVVILIGIIAWFAGYSDATDKIDQLHTAINTPQGVEQWRQLDADFSAWRAQHSYLGFYYPEKKLGTAVHDAYVHKLQEEFISNVVFTIGQSLRADLSNPQELYATLKVYLMFVYPEHMDTNFVEAWMGNYWKQEFGQDPNTLAKLNSELSDALSVPMAPMNLDDQLITQARNTLRQMSLPNIAYMNLVQQISTQNPGDVVLYGMTRDSFAQVFSFPGVTPVVSKLYTPDGWRQLYKEQYYGALKETLRGDWVLGQHGKMPPVTAAMEAQMQTAYYQDYIEKWEKELSKIDVIKCDSIKQMNQLLLVLSGGNSPLTQIVQVVNTNTTLSSNFLQSTLKKAPKKGRSDVFVRQAQKVIPQHTTPVDYAFASLHDLQLSNIQKALAATTGYMQSINNPKAAFEAAKNLMSGNAQNPLLQLLQQADQAPQPINRWLQEIVQQCIGLIFQEARHYIQMAWQDNIYPIYAQSISERYPLVKSASQETTATDFGAFFAPQGEMDKFFKAYFQPFAQLQAEKLAWFTVDGQPIGFSDATLNMLRHIEFIKNAYFTGSGKTPSVSFTMTPLILDENVASSDIIIGGKHLTYKHGPRYPSSVTWPGKDADGNVTINFTNLTGQTATIANQGDWGLFRLFDKYQIKPTKSANSYIAIFSVGQQSAAYLLQSSSNYNFFNLSILHGLRLPREL